MSDLSRMGIGYADCYNVFYRSIEFDCTVHFSLVFRLDVEGVYESPGLASHRPQRCRREVFSFTMLTHRQKEHLAAVLLPKRVCNSAAGLGFSSALWERHASISPCQAGARHIVVLRMVEYNRCFRLSIIACVRVR